MFLFRLLLAVLGIYLALRALRWATRALVLRSRTPGRPDSASHQEGDGSPQREIPKEDIQDARYTEIDPKS